MSLVKATRYVHALELVDIDELVCSGVRFALVDRDNTCVPRDTGRAPQAVHEWLCRARAKGITPMMVSNNFHGTQVRASAAELGVEVIDHAMKPLPFALTKALKRLGARPEEAVMIGDQVLTDVIAGNLSGMRTILVRPQCTIDNWYTRIFRIVEGSLLASVRFEGE